MATRKNSSKERYPSVSAIIGRFKESGALIHWAWKAGSEGVDFRDLRKAAQNVGKCVEAAIEAEIFGEPQPKIPADIDAALVRRGVESFRAWRDTQKVSVAHTQMSLTNETHRFVGRLDALAMVGDAPVILEWKAAGGIYLDNLLQVAAYRIALLEQPIATIGALPDRAVLVRIDRDDGTLHPQAWDLAALEAAGEMFLVLRKAFELDKHVSKLVAA